jgi:hypothetical protein
MNSQNGNDITRVKGEIDRIVQGPAYGAPQRDAINSVIDGIAGNLCSEITALRKELDLIEQRALTSAAGEKHKLSEHVSDAAVLHDAVGRLREVISGLAQAHHAA